MEDGAEDCCRLVAPAGPTALTLALNCTVLPMFTCYVNGENRIKGAYSATADPGSCCEACGNEVGCVSWTHLKAGSKTAPTYSCNLYSTVGPTKADDHTGCSAGIMPGAKPTPPKPPEPRNGRPNILFLIVESTDGRTWTPGYSKDAIKLPNLRALQKGGLNFQKHFSNSPVCCPSRSAFWSGLHVSNMPHKHPGYPNITVGGAWNNYEGLPVRPSQTRLSRLADDDLRRSYPSCTGLFALRMTAALNRKWWSVCRTGSRTGWTRR